MGFLDLEQAPGGVPWGEYVKDAEPIPKDGRLGGRWGACLTMAVLAERLQGIDGAPGEVIDFLVECGHGDACGPLAEGHEAQCNEALMQVPGLHKEEDDNGFPYVISGDAHCCGDTVVLTEAENSKQGCAMCLRCFSDEGEIKVSFKYLMDYGSGADGLCIALVDPSDPRCILEGEYGGGLGFDNRPGTLVGIGLDSWGNFGGGRDAAVVKAGWSHDYSLIAACEEIGLQGEGKVKIKFDLDDDKANVTVKIRGDKVIDEAVIEHIHLPDTMAVAFFASTGACNNKHVIWDVKTKEEFEWDDDD